MVIENRGNMVAQNFVVQWWAKTASIGCHWTVDTLAAGTSKVLSCPYTYHTSMNQNVQLVVDSGRAVNESNEDNNVIRDRLDIRLH